MILQDPGQTPFDLRFRLGTIPVRVHPMFWLVGIVMGWNQRELGLEYVALWVACVFVSILVHELGHILMGQFFGSDGHIVLHGFGGLAIGSNDLSSRGQRIAVSFAGPAAGFLLFAVVMGVLAVADPGRFAFEVWQIKSWFGLADLPELLNIMVTTGFKPGPESLYKEAVDNLVYINLFWGLVNLLPIWPLDGGQISRDFIRGIQPRDGVRISLGISIAVAGFLAINSLLGWMNQRHIPHLAFGRFGALMFGIFAVNNFLELQQMGPSGGSRRRYDDGGDRLPWERDPDYWKSGRRDPYD